MNGMVEMMKTVMVMLSGATGRCPAESRMPAVVRGECSRSVESVSAHEVLTEMMSMTSGLTERLG